MSNDNTVTITRKLALIPVSSYTKEWDKKIYSFTMDNVPKQIDKLKKKKIPKDNAEKDKERKQQIQELQRNLARAKEYREYTQKMIYDYTYDLVRTAMEEEAARKNYILSWIYSAMITHGVQHMDKLQDRYKFITDTINCAYRKKGSVKGSLFDDTEISNMLGGYGFDFNQALTKKIKDAVKDGLLEGKKSLPTFKSNSPFTVSKKTMGFSHDYDSFEELCEHIYDSNCNLYFDYGGNQTPTIARFKINIGSRKNKGEIIETLLKVYSGEYEYCGSTIQISKNKIILNLSMNIPAKDIELDENVVVGVDIGFAVPAYCGLNNNNHYHCAIGSEEDLLKIRVQKQNQLSRAQQSAKFLSGGHGAEKKLKVLSKFEKKERNFVRTYNHKISKDVIDFALKHRAKYINLEDLKGIKTNEILLRNWSRFELQQFITYKATKYGMEVRKINPYRTSQTCSVCGHWEEGQRKGREFVCKKCGAKLHADFNASRNISMSTDFRKDKSKGRRVS